MAATVCHLQQEGAGPRQEGRAVQQAGGLRCHQCSGSPEFPGSTGKPREWRMLSSEPMEKSLEALGTQMLVEVQGRTLMSEK